MTDEVDLNALLLEGRRTAEKLRREQIERPEYRARALGQMPGKLCQWCQNIYHGFQLDISQREQLNAVTLTAGTPSQEPPNICELCFDSVVNGAMRKNNASSYDIGQSNSGPPNLVMQYKYGK